MARLVSVVAADRKENVLPSDGLLTVLIECPPLISDLLRLGQSTQVARSTVEEVRAKLAELRSRVKEKDAQREYDFESRVAEIARAEKAAKEEKKRKKAQEKEERKRKEKEERLNGGAGAQDEEMMKMMGFGGFGGSRK